MPLLVDLWGLVTSVVDTGTCIIIMATLLKETKILSGSLYYPLQSAHNPYIRSGPEVIKLFSYSTQLSMKFLLLINVKMPTIVGILTFISTIDTTS